MRLHINLTALENQITELEKQSVTVGILSDTGAISDKAASIDFSKGFKPLASADLQQGIGSLGMQSVNTRYVKAKGRNKNISLRRLAFYLDEQSGVFTDALTNVNNADLLIVAQELAVIDKDGADINRLENASKSLIKNPILRGDLGENSPKWAAKKGFSHYGIATGTFFKNIEAAYKKW